QRHGHGRRLGRVDRRRLPAAVRAVALRVQRKGAREAREKPPGLTIERQLLSVNLLSTVVVAGLCDAALRTISRSMSVTLCSRPRRDAVRLENWIVTALRPAAVVTRIALAITTCGGVPAGRPTASGPLIPRWCASDLLSRTSKWPGSCSLTE